MVWDASTDAAVAALLVAFVALIVTSAQAVQQYLASGQLIRICDSVVYGKMPGQGRRIWEFSQFRFRVVYSIPQISLPLSLWSDIPSHALSDEEGDLTLPDLRTSIAQSKLGIKQAIVNQFDIQMGRTRDLICGEASWVSFCRAIQYSGGNSLRYEMIEGDADRCPTDLPVVPMQLSMRDVITVAMMAGMECTDVSYQQQSLSMRGSAGTITSSRHPILGALIHFAPKLPHEKHGFRVNDGTVNPQWVARMRDSITVGGQRYDMRDRKHIEEDEGNWVMLSDDRSIVKYREKSVRDPVSAIGKLRRRRVTRGNQASQSEELVATNQLEHSAMEEAVHKLNDPMNFSMRRPQDGEWSFSSEGSEAEEASINHNTGYLPLSDFTQTHVYPSRNWYYQLTSFLRRRLSTTINLSRFIKKPSVLPVSEPTEKSRNKIQPEAKAMFKQSNTETENSAFPTNHPVRVRNEHPQPSEDGVRLETFEDQVTPRPRVLNNEIHDDSQPTPRRLLLTNKEATKSQDSSIQVRDDWYEEQEKKLAAARAEQIGRKWQSIVRRRQVVRARKSRKEQDWLRHKSDPRRSDKIHEGTAPNSLQLRIGDSGLGHVRSPDNQSEPESDLSSPNRFRSGSRKKNSMPLPQKVDTRKPIPTGARWTKIDRRLVNPQALEESHELFEERTNCVVVLRVLTREEIEVYALRTMEIREAKRMKGQENSDSSDTSSFSEASKKSFEGLPYEAPRKEALPTKNGFGKDPYPGQLPDQKDSGPSPWEDESEVDDLHQGLVESPSTEPKPRGLENTRSVQRRASFSNDVITYRSAPSSVDLDDKVRQHDKALPKARSPEKGLSRKSPPADTTSTINERQQDFQEAHPKHTGQGKRHRKRAEPRVRRHSSTHTDKSNAFQNELLDISSDSILKKVRQRIKQCKDIPVALEYFLESQTDQRYSIDEVIAIRNQLKHTAITMKKILIIAKQVHEQRNLENWTVSDLEILVANLGKCLDVLESDFELFEITHMDVKSQQKTWDEMLLIFESQNSNSLFDYLQITCSFGNTLLASLSAGNGSSHESDELKEILLEMNQMQPESSISMLPKRISSSKVSPRRTRRTHRTRLRRNLDPYGSDDFSGSETGSLSSEQRQRPKNRHKKKNQEQDVSSSVPVGREQVSPTGAVNWFWICQVDIIPGYFATPWKGCFSEAVCIGAISTILKSLDALIEGSTRRYLDKTHRRCQDWIRAGNSTYPSYALNAKGGVVVSGLYKPVPFAGFPSPLPPIELLHSYDHQVRRGVRHQYQQPSAIVDDLAELMGLDTWLSFCGRAPPISFGPSNLLRTLPALAQLILSDFEFEFANLDRTTSTDGGFQLIQTVAESLTAALTEQNLSDPERLFALVAFLRAAKTALCVVRGSDTAKLRDVLEHDVQVYLA
ncbi:hypothetical protein MMC22_000974 [Lobaria immixta]|nr:hypothetical protein [Lobaria immixta]